PARDSSELQCGGRDIRVSEADRRFRPARAWSPHSLGDPFQSTSFQSCVRTRIPELLDQSQNPQPQGRERRSALFCLLDRIPEAIRKTFDHVRSVPSTKPRPLERLLVASRGVWFSLRSTPDTHARMFLAILHDLAVMSVERRQCLRFLCFHVDHDASRVSLQRSTMRTRCQFELVNEVVLRARVWIMENNRVTSTTEINEFVLDLPRHTAVSLAPFPPAVPPPPGAPLPIATF